MSESMPQKQRRCYMLIHRVFPRRLKVWAYTAWMSATSAPELAPAVAESTVLVLDTRALAQRIGTAIRAGLPHARIAQAEDRRTFLDALQSARWSLVIVSFDLEGYPGLEALADAARQSSAPVIAIGESATPREVVGALRNGAADFMVHEDLPELGALCTRLLGPAAAYHRRHAQGHDCLGESSEWLLEQHAIIRLDEQWVITHCSPGAATVLKYVPDDLIGQPLDTLFTGIPDAMALGLRLRALNAEEPVRDSGWMLRRDGLRMWAEVSCVAEGRPDGDAGGPGPGYCLTVRDATLQYRATHHVRSQAQSAVSATLARNLFLGSIAHELRAALAPIATSAILMGRPSLDAAVHGRLAGIVQRNAAAASRLVEDLLTFSTASENKLLMRLEQVDLHRLLSDCAEAVRPQAEASGIALHLDLLAPESEACLQCDPGRIQQVLMNLLGNAVKFTPAGGSIHLRTTSSPEGFAVDVSDTGVGIDPAALPFIFDPFEQGGAEVTSGYGGFGLGLAICAAIARQHGGNIVATSPGVGHGATFRLSLPQAGAEPATPQRERTEPAALHVLYVEDNPDAADAMRYALTTLGWTMTHAATCARARQLVQERGDSFDVILADLGLPDGSGLELGKELCEYLPVVALTAYGAPLVMQGFTHQLIKPAEISEVQRALLRAVAVHQRTRV